MPQTAPFFTDSSSPDHINFLLCSSLSSSPTAHTGPVGSCVPLLSSSLVSCSETAAGHSVSLISRLQRLVWKIARSLPCCLQVVLQSQRFSWLFSALPGLAVGNGVWELWSLICICIDAFQSCIADFWDKCYSKKTLFYWWSNSAFPCKQGNYC